MVVTMIVIMIMIVIVAHKLRVTTSSTGNITLMHSTGYLKIMQDFLCGLGQCIMRTRIVNRTQGQKVAFAIGTVGETTRCRQ